jgi:hypothetical protein
MWYSSDSVRASYHLPNHNIIVLPTYDFGDAEEVDKRTLIVPQPTISATPRRWTSAPSLSPRPMISVTPRSKRGHYWRFDSSHFRSYYVANAAHRSVLHCEPILQPCLWSVEVVGNLMHHVVDTWLSRRLSSDRAASKLHPNQFPFPSVFSLFSFPEPFDPTRCGVHVEKHLRGW